MRALAFGRRCALFHGVGQIFNAKEFLDKLNQGAFGDRLRDEFRKLSHEQREQVALLIAKRLKQEASAKDYAMLQYP